MRRVWAHFTNKSKLYGPTNKLLKALWAHGQIDETLVEECLLGQIDVAHRLGTDYAKRWLKSLARDVKPGSQILIADGSIVLEVLSCDLQASEVRCRCKNTATLGERKNCNLPGVNVDLPTLTEKGLTDILQWGVPNDIDFIAASFVRKAEDLDNIRQEIMAATGRPTDIKIISKIENQEGLVNFDEILEKTDAIMVARGGE